MASILIVEDDPSIRRGLKDTFRFCGYETLEAATGTQGLELALRAHYDLLLLDLILPGTDGLEILRQTRDQQPTVPIIILTARGEEHERVQGLRKGADDYVVKPFSIRELLARVESVLRRTPERPLPTRHIPLGNGVADLEQLQLRHQKGEHECLTEREAALLAYFARNPGRVISREEIRPVLDWQQLWEATQPANSRPPFALPYSTGLTSSDSNAAPASLRNENDHEWSARLQNSIQQLSFHALLNRVTDRLRERASQAGLKLKVVPSNDATASVATDVSAVEQILFNLIDNACKHGKPSAAPEIELSAQVRNGAAVLRVRDYGPGINPWMVARLFKPFSKSAQESANTAPGIGLGLALCRRLSRELGGSLRRCPMTGQEVGTAFELKLPMPPNNL